VISVVCGDAQLALIEAALQAGVARFIPAEFGASPLRRPPDDPLDRGQAAALNRLRQYESEGMAHTVVSCGILYERFAPGGMSALGIGGGCGATGEGDYLVNIRSMRSQIPHDASGYPARLSMTAAQDVARFLVAALDLPDLPTELRMCGSRMSVSDVVQVAEVMRRTL
jgi:nucleoside-diphosphate-sugar epimerase